MIRDDPRPILKKYPAIAQPCSACEPLGNAGGGSGAWLWRYISGRGPLVIRAWPPDGLPRPAIEQVHQWLIETADLGFIPVPLVALDGRTLHEHAGRLWEVSPWLPGEAESNHPPSRVRVRAGFAALAALHQCLAHHRAIGPSPGLRARLNEIQAWLNGGFEVLDRHLAVSLDPLSPSARRWVSLARPLAPTLIEPVRQAIARDA